MTKHPSPPAASPNGAKPKNSLPPKPYSEYTIFFRLEHALLIQTSGDIDEELLSSLDPHHRDLLELPRPSRYTHLVLPPFWYSSAHYAAVAKKRKHRKRKGNKRMDMKTLSKTISARWNAIQQEERPILHYCRKLAQAEMARYQETCCKKMIEADDEGEQQEPRPYPVNYGRSRRASPHLADGFLCSETAELMRLNQNHLQQEMIMTNNRNSNNTTGTGFMCYTTAGEEIMDQNHRLVAQMARNKFPVDGMMYTMDDEERLQHQQMMQQHKTEWVAHAQDTTTTTTNCGVESSSSKSSIAMMNGAGPPENLTMFRAHAPTKKGEPMTIVSPETGVKLPLTAEGDQSLTTRSSFSENGSNSNGSSVVGNNNSNGMAANQAEYDDKMNYLMKLSEETHELERRYNMLHSFSDGSNNANDAADKGKAKAGYDKAMTEKQNYFLQLSRENRELERRNNLMTIQQLNYNAPSGSHQNNNDIASFIHSAASEAMGRIPGPVGGMFHPQELAAFKMARGRGMTPQQQMLNIANRHFNMQSPSAALPQDQGGASVNNEEDAKIAASGGSTQLESPSSRSQDQGGGASSLNDGEDDTKMETSLVNTKDYPSPEEVNSSGDVFIEPEKVASSCVVTDDCSKEPETLPVSMFIPSDVDVLDDVNIFLRSHCIQLFARTENDMMMALGRSLPCLVGQVGFRCYFCRDVPFHQMKAFCFPSKRDTIYENVRGFQRTHLEVCPNFPEEKMVKYKALIQGDLEKGRNLRYAFLKKYYADMASDLGLVDTPHGLRFKAVQKDPKEEARKLIELMMQKTAPRSSPSDDDDTRQSND